MKNQCPFCKGKMKDGEATFSVDMEFGVVVVRNVPATVCSLCGSEWFSDSVSEELEEIVASARKKSLVVEVSNWRQPVEA